MKRLTLIIAMVACFVANGQEFSREGRWQGEFATGLTTFGNYPAMSLFQDPTDKYSNCIGFQYTLGYYFDNSWLLGLTVNKTSGYTSQLSLEESFELYSVLLDIRNYYGLTERITVESGVAVGLLVGNNRYVHLDEVTKAARYGVRGCVSLGLNYQVTPATHVGLQLNLPDISGFFTEVDVPAGLVPTKHALGVGYSLMLTLGGCF